MTNIVNVSDFRNNISDYINRIMYHGEDYYLKRGKAIVAKVIFVNPSDEKITASEKILELSGLWSEKEAKKIERYLKKIDTKSLTDLQIK